MPPQEKEVIIESIRDLEYIREMKRLEHEIFGKTSDSNDASCTETPTSGSGGVSHIVPITGLVFNHLHRLENELKTANSHWAHRMNEARYHSGR